MSYSAILFNKDHVKTLEYEKRFPPTSIGARRIRPSSTNVLKEMKRQKRLKKEQNTSTVNVPTEQQEESVPSFKISHDGHLESHNERQYFQFKVDERQIQEEIDEIRGIDRSAYHNLPVILTPEMSVQAQKHHLLMPNTILNENSSFGKDGYKVLLSDSLTEQWIQALQQEISHAECIRSKEQMRPMAYKLVPEKWTRLCPSPTPEGVITSVKETENDPQFTIQTGDILMIQSISNGSNTAWRSQTRAIVIDYLYNTYPSLEMADGAKFGSDILLYDGSRKSRHALGGIRILTSSFQSSNSSIDSKVEFQIPTAFDLHGYVRALNTAGKLALLATAVHNEIDQTFHVAIVDLALEKILSAPTHLKRKRSEVRKEVGKHLSKNPHLG